MPVHPSMTSIAFLFADRFRFVGEIKTLNDRIRGRFVPKPPSRGRWHMHWNFKRACELLLNSNANDGRSPLQTISLVRNWRLAHSCRLDTPPPLRENPQKLASSLSGNPAAEPPQEGAFHNSTDKLKFIQEKKSAPKGGSIFTLYCSI